MNLKAEIGKIKEMGYSEALASARLCQDLILKAISVSDYSSNVTIKGGVVMRNLSRNSRRATQDLDFDFIKYSIEESSVVDFFNNINVIDGIEFEVDGRITELKHLDYKGKRVNLVVSDSFGNELQSKVDIGVHNLLDIEQEMYTFDICFQEDGVSLLANSAEQMLTEKLISLLRFGTRSTRYKDIFDMCFLSDNVKIEKLRTCLTCEIFEKVSLPVDSVEDILRRIEVIKDDVIYLQKVDSSKQNWSGLSSYEAFERLIMFLKSV